MALTYRRVEQLVTIAENLGKSKVSLILGGRGKPAEGTKIRLFSKEGPYGTVFGYHDDLTVADFPVDRLRIWVDRKNKRLWEQDH